MDKDTFDIITKLNDDQNKSFAKQLDAKEERDTLKFKGIQKSIEAGLETVAIEIRKLNGNIKVNESDIEDLKKQTSWWRFFQRNAKSTLIFLLIFLIGVFVIIGADIKTENIYEFIKHLKFW